MANRRFGGGGNHQRGGLNRGFAPPSNISPWQGGVPPGNANNNIQNQLALALTSLLHQTQQQASEGPPSLLNMNTSPGFFSQDQFNNQNRFGNHGRQDFRRSEPFNKNRGGGWRSDSNNRNNNRGSNNFSPKIRSNFRDRNQPSKDKFNKNDKKSNIDKIVKQEKPAESNAEARAEKDVKKEVKLEKNDSENEGKKEGRESKPTKYDGLPNGLLHCFVCNKSMWDGESFQNHLGGKAHKQMIGSLEESFQITVNILRENMRLCEERKMIEYERMQRSRRYHHNIPSETESHCNMCDLKFMGKIVVHRQTEGHQRLKRFLHPKCKRCNLEFPSRMEWVDHQFAPEHLFGLKEYLESKKLEPGEYKLRVRAEMDNEPLLEENVQNEDDSPVLELSEDLTNLFNRIPVFKPDRLVSKESLSASSGFICDLCRLYLPSEEESQTHLKSFNHYQAFVEAVKAKYQKTNAEKKKKTDEEEATEEGTVKKEEDSKECTKDDEEMEKLLDDDGEDKEEAAEEENDKEEEKAEEVEKEEEAEGVKEEEKKEEEKKEPEKKAPVPVPTTPNTRAKRGGGVRNGAGPKSKKAKM